MSGIVSSVIPADGLRPLPPRPNLEFERKRAKKLTRARKGEIKLADAQRIIAREYGFASWRKLVAYYETWDRHERTGPSYWLPGGGIEREVESLLHRFERRRALESPISHSDGLGAELAAFVPRFYGSSDTEIFASTLTEAEARLVVARCLRWSSWDALREYQTLGRAQYEEAKRARERDSAKPIPRGPITLASMAEGASDYERIAHFFADHPSATTPPAPGSRYHDLIWDLVFQAIQNAPDPHDMLAWVGSLGIDMQPHLDHALLGFERRPRTPADIQSLLDLGANPSWMPPNGYGVLEHAIVRYRNGDAVDLIACRVVPRKVLWVAAGLGDVRTMLRFIDRQGLPNDAARRDRPDVTALSPTIRLGPGRPEASDLDVLWEAFVLAATNGRIAAMDALLDRGFPIDHSPHWFTALHIAVDDRHVDVVEQLLRRGADPDVEMVAGEYSPRQLAQILSEETPVKDARSEEIHRLFSRY